MVCPAATPRVTAGVSEITDDGAWCWYSDPRAFCNEGVVYSGWVTQFGDIRVAEHDLSGGATFTATIAADFERDDHANPSFHVTSDGRITAFYSKHSLEGSWTMYRTSAHPWNTSSWSEQHATYIQTAGDGGSTYSHPVAAPGQPDTIFLFWRGWDWKPNYSIGAYDPESRTWSWSSARTLITSYDGRPYAKYAASPDGRIAIAFTDGHPSETRTELYFAYFGESKCCRLGYFRSDGTLIKHRSEGPLQPHEAEVVYRGAQSPDTAPVEPWVWDVAVSDDGTPAIVYASFPTRTHHRYHWAFCEDGRWHDRVLVENSGGSIADTTIAQPQYYYSGGLVLDSSDIGTVYLSRRNGNGGWDVER